MNKIKLVILELLFEGVTMKRFKSFVTEFVLPLIFGILLGMVIACNI